MGAHGLGWTADTCGCVFDLEFDDEDTSENPALTVLGAQPCRVHAVSLPSSSSFTPIALTDEFVVRSMIPVLLEGHVHPDHVEREPVYRKKQLIGHRFTRRISTECGVEVLRSGDHLHVAHSTIRTVTGKTAIDLYALVHDGENVRKNVTEHIVLEHAIEHHPELLSVNNDPDASPTLRDGVYQWSFDKKRVLRVNLPKHPATSKKTIQQRADREHGAAKVKVM